MKVGRKQRLCIPGEAGIYVLFISHLGFFVESIHPLGCSRKHEVCKLLHGEDWYIRREWFSCNNKLCYFRQGNSSLEAQESSLRAKTISQSMVHQHWCSDLCSRTSTFKCRQQPLFHTCYKWLNSHIITVCWWHLSHWRLCWKDQHHLSTTSMNLWHGGFGIVDSFSWIGVHLST
jgi:hypothetical protein